LESTIFVFGDPNLFTSVVNRKERRVEVNRTRVKTELLVCHTKVPLSSLCDIQWLFIRPKQIQQGTLLEGPLLKSYSTVPAKLGMVTQIR
jgi:hypothetical protein